MPEAPPSLCVPPSRFSEPSFTLSSPCRAPGPFRPASSPSYSSNFLPLIPAAFLSPATSAVSAFSRRTRSLSFSRLVFPLLLSPPHTTSFFFFSTAAPLSPSVRLPFLPLPLLREHPFLQSEVSSTCDSLRILIMYKEERRDS